MPKDISEAPDAVLISAFDFSVLALYTVACGITTFMPRSPRLHFPPERLYSPKTLASSAPLSYDNVTGYVWGSIYSVLLFAYTTPIVMLGYTSESLEIRDLPILPGNMRATPIFVSMRKAYQQIRLPRSWRNRVGDGWELLWKLAKVNSSTFMLQVALAAITAFLYYLPAFFLQALVHFLEVKDAGGTPDPSWGWVYCAGLFLSNAINYSQYDSFIRYATSSAHTLC